MNEKVIGMFFTATFFRKKLLPLLFALFVLLVLSTGCVDQGGGRDEAGVESQSMVESSESQKDGSVGEVEEAIGEQATEESSPEKVTKGGEEAEGGASAGQEAVTEGGQAEEAVATEEEMTPEQAEAEEQKRQAEEERKRKIEEEKKIQLAKEEAKIYDIEIEQLTLRDCVRCHISQTSRLREKGGKHRFVPCMDCHRQYHAYNPPRENFTDIMPKCMFCHDYPHGDDKRVLVCLNCHSDPHQPRNVRHPEKIEEVCRVCHPPIAALLEKAPSKHTEQKCSSCHSDVHGRKPDCAECHKNHSPDVYMETADCLKCHPVHTPLQIKYPVTQSKKLCGGCHKKPYNDLKVRQTKHSKLTCAKCHPRHGQLMRCQDCHGERVHHAPMHENKPECGECHSIAHKLDK